MPTFGVEEEVFITEPERPTIRSLYFLAKLLARNPRYYYTHSASNFSRGPDLRQGLMSGVEISTGIHNDVEELADDLQERRRDLSAVASGLIVPVGHLPNFDAPTNTCSLQVHVGGVANKERVYRNLLHFLPILPLFTINSPMAAGKYFGQSYRMNKSFAIGPILDDWTIRFQDLILSKRIGTVELRACDPCPDMKRVRWLLRAVSAVASLDDDLDPNPERYNGLRDAISRKGLLDETADLVEELQALINFPIELIQRTASDELHELYGKNGLVAAYSAADNCYRNGVFEPREVKCDGSGATAEGILGFVGYFIPRLPYYAWKGLVE
jgi:gamma-glutamyl:cysteine ligase YbdK (ATP-grasp superfamily)